MVQIGGGKRVLIVGGEGVVLYAPARGGVDRETAISWELPNFDAQLIDVLSDRNAGKSVMVLFDGVDQTYRKEDTVPKLSPLDRPRFVKRKLELAFPAYPIRASVEIKPPKGSRGQLPSYLFVALPETEQIDRIGNALLESGVPVAGFGLLPLESASLVSELAAKTFSGKDRKQSRWSILIGQHETGGLRQIVVKDGNLALTRLTPVSDVGISGPGWAEEVMREFKATLTYISRFGYNQDDGLDVVVVCGDIEKQFFNEKEMGVTHFRCLNPSEALKAIGAKSYGLDKSNYADALHAAWSGRKNSLKLPVRIPSIHRIMAPRLAARAASFLLLVTALGLGYLTFTDFQAHAALQEEITQRQNQKVMLDREFSEESKIFEVLPVKPDLIKGTLAVKKMLDTNTVPVSPLLHRLKKSLGNDIYLTELKYEHTPSAVLPVGTATAAASPFGIPPSGFLPDGTPDRGKIKLNFRFSLPANMPLEQKVLRAEALEKTLITDFPGYDVRIVAQFGKVSRQGKFEGGLGTAANDRSASEDLAEFSLEGPPL